MGMIPFSDLVRYVREHIGISGPQPKRRRGRKE